MSNLGDEIAKLCLDKYNSLKKTGKPSDREWTVLACVVLRNESSMHVVSLATGTKCLGANELMKTNLYNIGDRLSDSHAEILTRRALLRYMYDQIDQLFSSATSDAFILNSNRQIELKSNVSFYFYCSQTPCGDCSIIPKLGIQTIDNFSGLPIKIMRVDNDKKFDEDVTIQKKRCPAVEDVHRTGAKCVKTEVKQDCHLPGVDYHVVGPLRTKPGRGDATLSLSCSDKMAKWNILGVQGALLSLLIPKIRMEIIVIGGGCPFSLEAIERGLYRRFNNLECIAPKIIQSSMIFPHMKSHHRINPCSSSIIWCSVSNRDHEVAVDGRKQGATKNKRGSNLLVTKQSLLLRFLQTLDKHPYTPQLLSHPKAMTYYDYKQWSTAYQKSWSHLRKTIFKSWTTKPTQFQQFSLKY